MTASPVALDVDAERAVLAQLVLHPEQWEDVAERLAAADFAGPGHAALFNSMTQLVAEHGTFDVIALYAAPAVKELVALLVRETPAVGLLDRHVRRVARAATARRMVHRYSDAANATQDLGNDPLDVFDGLAAAVEAENETAGLPAGYEPFDQWAQRGADAPRPWVVPGVLRRAGRLVLVGAEGAGKSTLTRQIAVAVASGWHPFRAHRIEPRRVMVVDAENDPSTAIAEDGSIDRASPLGLVITAENQASEWDRSRLAVWSRPDGLDLRSRRDIGGLHAAIRDHRPDLVVVGPMYKVVRRLPREDDETFGADVQRILDRLRARFDVALVLEHHAPKAQNGSRPIDPFGSSLWKRWPDIGVTLVPTGDERTLRLDRFRGDRYRVTGLPDSISHGAVWPWVGRWNHDGGAVLSRAPE